MGSSSLQYVLVIMTNGDVYYLNQSSADGLQKAFEQMRGVPFYETSDAKSGKSLKIFFDHISSIVAEG